MTLADWADAHMLDVEEARDRYEAGRKPSAASEAQSSLSAVA
jgi:hypothetical protein